MNKWVLSTVAVVALVAFVGFSSAGDKSDKAKDKGSIAIGQPAPQFALQDQNGKTHNLADYNGKYVVLEWFNNECPYVVKHYQSNTMTNLAKKYADKDVVWLAINTTAGKTNNDNKAIAGEWNISYPILNDSTGQVGKQYGAKTTPHMFIIDKTGNVVYAGAIDNDPRGNKSEDRVNYVDKALSELASGQSVSEPQTKPYGCSVKYAN